MIPRKFKAAQPTAQQMLQSLCDAAEGAFGAEFGGRVWLLPPWYLIAAHRDPTSIRLTYTEVAIRLSGKPTMCRLASVHGGSRQVSKVRWTVGKGLVGHVTSRKDGFDVIQHQRAWPPGVDNMSERDWKRLGASITRSRSLKDVQALQKLYATAVGVSLADPDSGAALGCVTLHTRKGSPLTDVQADDVTLMMMAKMPEMARQIVGASKLKLSKN